jgi:transcriptional regulator with XRE-family HTH domain
MGFWAKSRQIYSSLREHGKQSIRQLAEHTGLSKSSVHRLEQARDSRNRYPESWFWETEEGQRWFIRLVVATLYTFGLKRGVGAETLSEFFVRLHLDTHLGCSPSALQRLLHVLEQAIEETTAAREKEGIAQGEVGPIIGAVDETFLQHLMLVLMDLVSGYLVLEEVAPDRSYDTWNRRVAARLEALGAGVRYVVSDRAKALIKLARTGLDCLSIPDLFHLIHELVKSHSLAIAGRVRQARQALSQAQERLAKCEASDAHSVDTEQARALVETSRAEVGRWETVRSTYRHHLETLSLIVHPWRVTDSTRQSSEEVEGRLRDEIDAIEAFMETTGLAVKKTALDKVRKQLADLAALIDLWWQGVEHDLQQVILTPIWRIWVQEVLLPLMYWREQLARTRCPRRKARIRHALEAVEEAWQRHPITQQLSPEVLADWTAWAAQQAKAFQRASSAVEGRNGYLSQMHHNHRGLPKRRYRVWTALHNFDHRASDGTTPASRFFRREFPDLFETVLSHIEELPRPRQRHQVIELSA